MERVPSFPDLKIERHLLLPFNCPAGVVKIVYNRHQEVDWVFSLFFFRNFNYFVVCSNKVLFHPTRHVFGFRSQKAVKQEGICPS